MCTCALTTSPTCNAYLFLPSLYHSLWDIHWLLINIFKIDREKTESFETFRTHWHNAPLFSAFSCGVGKISTSWGNLNSQPITARLRGMSVPSIGALFQAYLFVFAFWWITVWVYLSLPAIFCVLLRNLWNLSTELPRWLPHDIY